MSRDPCSLTLPSETDVLTVSPLIGPAACTASPRATSPCTASSVQSPSILSGTPLTASISKVLLDIDGLPSPPCSPAFVITEPLVCASSLTERTLRSQRRDALRTTYDVAVALSLDTVRSHATLAENDVPARISHSRLPLPFTLQRHAPVYDYRISATTPRVTTLVANHPPFTDRVCPPGDFSPLTPLRASRSMSSSTSSGPKKNNRTASSSPSATHPPLDLSPVPLTDIRDSTGSGTGRTPGLRPAAPLPRAFSTASDGPPPHLGHLAPIWDSLKPAQQAAMKRVSLHDVEEGLADARVSDDPPARTVSDQHAHDLATAEHERVAAPLCAQLTTLNRHSATARSGRQESARALEETTRTHREHETRLASLQAQTRSTAAALAGAERGHASFLAGLSTQPPAPPNFAALVAPATQQLLAPTHLATHVASAARQPPASANLATLVAPLVPQPLALSTSAVPTVPAATRPLDPTAPAATKPLVPPAVTFSARPTMRPPAPRDPSTSTPWSVVVSRAHRQPQHQPPSMTRNDAYLELRVSKLMFRNKVFPSDLRLPIKEHASEVHASLLQLYGDRCRLNRSLDLATQDRTPLSDRVVSAILRLRDLVESACGTRDGAQWVRDTLRDTAAKHRPDRTGSSASDSSTTTEQGRREDSSSGRGNAKRPPSQAHRIVTPASIPDAQDETDGKYPLIYFTLRSVNGSNTPPFPPRIFRPRVTQRLPPCATNSSVVNASGADPPPSLQQMVEAVTAAALATVDRHLAHMGLNPALVAPPPPPAGPVALTTHPAAVPTDNASPFVAPASTATPPTLAGSVAPTT